MKKIILLLTLSLAAAAQGQYTNTNYYCAPRTYFETFNATLDTVLIKGSSTIDTLNSQISYPVEVRAERITNPSTTNSVYAVSLRTTMPQVLLVDYIDYDELDALIRSVQYISQSTSAVSPMDNFETVIRTRSGLSIAKVGRGPKVVITMTSGYANGVRNQMAGFVLDQLGRDLTTAKAKLDMVLASGQ